MNTAKTLVSALCLLAAGNLSAQTYKFDFGTGEVAENYVGITPESAYSDEVGYGFEKRSSVEAVTRKKGDALTGDYITSEKPFSFSVKMPEGNWKVTVTLGDIQGTSKTSVRAEQRRLMLEGVTTAKKETVSKSFGVNVRYNKLSPGNTMKLDTREWNYETGTPLMFTWDEKLTLTFCDEHPCVCGVEIEPMENPIVIYVMGDSTVTDQAGDTYGTWGQALPRWFRLPVVVSNHAESGQTAKAFRFQRRWDKIVETIKPGDYVIMQFGTNDAKESGHDAMWPMEDAAGEWAFTHSEALTDYVWMLATYAVEVKRRGATPVIVSPMTKIDTRTGAVNSAPLGNYPEGAKRAAELAGCTYIDLFDMSIDIVKALGSEAPKGYADGTHSGNYGAYLFSRCIAKGLKEAGLGIADYLIDDAADFNPADPKPTLEEFNTAADNTLPRPRPEGPMPPQGAPGQKPQGPGPAGPDPNGQISAGGPM